MPSLLVTKLSEVLQASPDKVEKALVAFASDVKDRVTNQGYTFVPGLGTFRRFKGTLVFEPAEPFALSVNHRYAGLEPVIVESSPEEAPYRKDEVFSSDTDKPAEQATAAFMPVSPIEEEPETPPTDEESFDQEPIDTDEEYLPPVLPPTAGETDRPSIEAWYAEEPPGVGGRFDAYDEEEPEPEPEAFEDQPVAYQPDLVEDADEDPLHAIPGYYASGLKYEEHRENDAEKEQEEDAFAREMRRHGIEPYESSRRVEYEVPATDFSQPYRSEREERPSSRVTIYIAAFFLTVVLGVIAYTYVRPDRKPGAEQNPVPVTADTNRTDTSAAGLAATVDSLAAPDSIITPTTETTEDTETTIEQAPAVTQDNGPSSPLRSSEGIRKERGGWTLVVGSSGSLEAAQRAVKEYKDKGFRASVLYGTMKNVARYRMVIGQFETDGAALTAARNKSNGIPEGAWAMPIKPEMQVH